MPRAVRSLLILNHVRKASDGAFPESTLQALAAAADAEIMIVPRLLVPKVRGLVEGFIVPARRRQEETLQQNAHEEPMS
jgi:hypothetical protein